MWPTQTETTASGFGKTTTTEMELVLTGPDHCLVTGFKTSLDHAGVGRCPSSRTKYGFGLTASKEEFLVTTTRTVADRSALALET